MAGRIEKIVPNKKHVGTRGEYGMSGNRGIT
jgi:hypothetical protein